ncbi:MAG: sulfoxide reductase heme-binding subunit YedZ [Anaerolineales bacterium]|nr:MAG: sulfoxide reductase heme-binding subunit YedZ [Anaerolineales bacterium]
MSKVWGRVLQVSTHSAGWVPLIVMIIAWSSGNLTFNPVQAATIRTGRTAIIFLLLSLTVMPMNTLFGFKQLIPLRRWLGLYAFMYAAVHVSIFIGVDYGFDLNLLREAILEKPYAFVGAATFLLLLPLALTSTKGWMRRLKKNWKRLHRLVYIAAPLATIHYAWAQKADIRIPIAVGIFVVLLLGLRIGPIRAFASRLRYAPRSFRTRFASSKIGSRLMHRLAERKSL